MVDNLRRENYRDNETFWKFCTSGSRRVIRVMTFYTRWLFTLELRSWFELVGHHSFFLISGGRKSFCQATDPLFWTSNNVCPGFQSQSEFPRLCASSPVCNRFTYGATPANPLATCMVAELFRPCICTYIQALVGLKSKIKCAAASQHVTRQTLLNLKSYGAEQKATKNVAEQGIKTIWRHVSSIHQNLTG